MSDMKKMIISFSLPLDKEALEYAQILADYKKLSHVVKDLLLEHKNRNPYSISFDKESD